MGSSMKPAYRAWFNVVVLLTLSVDLVWSLEDSTPLTATTIIDYNIDTPNSSDKISRKGSAIARVKPGVKEHSPIVDSYDADDVAKRTPAEILKLRGFKSERHFVRTHDGYYIHVVRVINPLIKSKTLKRPVIFNHGLFESSTIFLINSHDVAPQNVANICGNTEDHPGANNKTTYLNGPMMLANYGYDVWLMSMRGTDFSLRHDILKPTKPEFWDYCLDDFAMSDVPSVINFVRKKTKALKVGYIGHSQATFSVFGLLSRKPHYANIIEPVVALAPVAYMDHTTSVGRSIFVGSLKLTSKSLHAPAPPNAKTIRSSFTDFCSEGKAKAKTRICRLLIALIGGAGKNWKPGYYSHLPFYSSLKVLRHFGQIIKQKNFQMYDYGKAENLKRYGTEKPFSYPIENIRSRTMCLISTKSDALSPPEDVKQFTDRLKVPLLKQIYIDRDFNHFDLITDEEAGKLVFKPILEIFEKLERESGLCASSEDGAEDYPIDENNDVNDSSPNEVEDEGVSESSFRSIEDSFNNDQSAEA